MPFTTSFRTCKAIFTNAASLNLCGKKAVNGSYNINFKNLGKYA
jgi:hypothetical protein